MRAPTNRICICITQFVSHCLFLLRSNPQSSAMLFLHFSLYIPHSIARHWTLVCLSPSSFSFYTFPPKPPGMYIHGPRRFFTFPSPPYKGVLDLYRRQAIRYLAFRGERERLCLILLRNSSSPFMMVCPLEYWKDDTLPCVQPSWPARPREESGSTDTARPVQCMCMSCIRVHEDGDCYSWSACCCCLTCNWGFSSRFKKMEFDLTSCYLTSAVLKGLASNVPVEVPEYALSFEIIG